MKAKRIYKRGRHPKYKTEAERKAARLEAQRNWRERNAEALLEHNRNYQREYYRAKVKAKGRTVKEQTRRIPVSHTLAPDIEKPISTPTLAPDIEKRLSALEKETKEILLDLEDISKENRELKNLVRWGINEKIPM